MTEELTRAQTATALRAEERYLVKRLAMVRELLADMPKPGPKPKTPNDLKCTGDQREEERVIVCGAMVAK